MGHFLSDLVICPQDDGVYWKVCTPFDYEVGEVGSGDKIEVPKDFLTDLGSVPQWFWNIIPPIGKPLRGYVVHDWLYYKQNRSRAQCDGVLLEAMEVAGVSRIKRWTIYLGVRAGGWLPWNRHAEENKEALKLAMGTMISPDPVSTEIENKGLRLASDSSPLGAEPQNFQEKGELQ